MTETTPEPGKNAGENQLRLDADRTRDELRDTLDALEKRLTPSELATSAKLTFREHPGQVIGIATGVVGAIVGIVLLKGRNRG